MLMVFSMTISIQSTAQDEKVITKFVIGIGGTFDVYNDVIIFLKDCPYVKIYALCETHQIIGVKILDVKLKDFQDFERYLEKSLGYINLFQKDDKIFLLDCKDEILKQDIK